MKPLAVLLCALCWLGAAALPGPAGAAGRITVTIGADPHSLIPILQTSVDEGAIEQMLFDTLIEYDSHDRPQPDLAATVPTLANGGISHDGKTITFHLRHDVRWHDGAPFTAADVRFTIAAILDPRHNVSNRTFYTNIRAVDTPNAYTVVFHLIAPQASFLGTVADGYGILPAHLLAKSADLATDPFAGAPVGTGPYKFVRWVRGEGVTLAANPAYFRGAPRNTGVTVKIIPDSNTLAIQLREHDASIGMVESSTYNALRHAPGVRVTTEPLNDFNALALNEHRPVLRDVRVRRAITLAVDRVAIARNVSFGTGVPAYADLPLFMYGGRPPAGWERSDPASAGKLLDAAGWHMGAGGIRVKAGAPLHLDLIGYSASASVETVLIEVQQMLRRAGIDAGIKTFATSLYFSPAAAGGPMAAGNFDIGILSFVGGVDPANRELYACDSRIPAGNNYAAYCSPEMERLQAAAEREYDPRKRDAVIARIEDLAVRDAVYVFLYHTPYRFAFDPTLHRTPASIDNRFYDIRDWTYR